MAPALPDAAFGILIEALSQWRAATWSLITPIEAELTTQPGSRAAGRLRRRTWSISGGSAIARKVGAHRRVSVQDLALYRKSSGQRRVPA